LTWILAIVLYAEDPGALWVEHSFADQVLYPFTRLEGRV
jgi:hypothetical protein